MNERKNNAIRLIGGKVPLVSVICLYKRKYKRITMSRKWPEV